MLAERRDGSRDGGEPKAVVGGIQDEKKESNKFFSSSTTFFSFTLLVGFFHSIAPLMMWCRLHIACVSAWYWHGVEEHLQPKRLYFGCRKCM